MDQTKLQEILARDILDLNSILVLTDMLEGAGVDQLRSAVRKINESVMKLEKDSMDSHMTK